MKSISLYDAYCFLQECKVIELEGRYLEPHILSFEEESDNEFLVLQWEEEYEGDNFIVEVVFEEGDNQMVEIEGRKLYLVNSEGDQEELLLLREMDLE
jgi:hypothetical protein